MGCVADVPVGKEVPFDIITTGAGKGVAKVVVNSPSKKIVPALTTASRTVEGYNSKFIPLEKGVHSVQVTFADQQVPGSPFTVTAGEVTIDRRYTVKFSMIYIIYLLVMTSPVEFPPLSHHCQTLS